MRKFFFSFFFGYGVNFYSLYLRVQCGDNSILFIFTTDKTNPFPVNYKVELHDPRSGGFMPSSPGIGMHVEVKDSDDKVILSRVYSSEGKYLH